MLAETEVLLANSGYVLKSVTECNGQIFVFLINESELKDNTRPAASASAPSKSHFIDRIE